MARGVGWGIGPGGHPGGMSDRRRMPGRMFDPNPIALDPGEWQTFDLGAMRVTGMYVSVLQGGLDVWFGNYSGSQLAEIPHLHFAPIGQPVWVPLPLGDYSLTVTPVSGVNFQCQGTVTFTGES